MKTTKTFSAAVRKELRELGRQIEGDLRDVLREDRRRLVPPTVSDASEEEDALRARARALERFEDALKRIPPNERETDEFEKWIGSWHQTLEDFEKKLHELFDEQEFPDLMKSFEGLLADAEKLLKSFEDILNRFRPASLRLLVSFENLLSSLIGLLESFEALLKRFKVPPTNLLESFEDLLKGRAESNVVGLEDLLKSFEKLVKEHHPGNKELIESFKRLVQGFLDLIGSMLDLKDKLNTVPEHLQSSDIALAFSYVELVKSKERLLEGLGSLSSDRMEEFVGSLIDSEKTLFRLVGILKKAEPLGIGVVRGVQNLSSRHGRLIGGASRLFRRVKRPSVFLLDMMEDLKWLQKQLEQTVKQLERA